MAAVVATLWGLSVTVLVLGLLRPGGSTTVRRRAERLWLPAPEQSDDDPFATRVLRPMVQALLRSWSRLLPQALVSSVATRLRTAGHDMSPGQFLARWIGAGIAPPVIVLLLLLTFGSTGTLTLMFVGVWLAAGGYLPFIRLRRQAETRTKLINKELPDAIDLIVTSVEAGLGIQQAIMTVAEKFTGAIGSEFSYVVAETRVGRPRADSLVDMATRSGSRDLTLFVRAINQAEEMGISIGGVLRNQSAEIRERRQQAAREQAAKIPVKMTIPTILLMLPTLFILILTPVVLNAMDSFGGG